MSSIPAPLAGRREWIGLAVIALPCLLYSMDLTVLNLAVPALSARPPAERARSCCGSSTSTASWSPGSLITMGTLGDRIGRRRLLLIGAAAFGVASVLAAFSTSAGDADRHPRAARRRRRDAGAVDALADPQHVPRPAAAHGRHRRLDHQLLGRRRDRPAPRRRAARALLVGLGVPAGGAGDGAAARGRAAAAAGVPRPERRAASTCSSAALSLAARARS